MSLCSVNGLWMIRERQSAKVTEVGKPACRQHNGSDQVQLGCFGTPAAPPKAPGQVTVWGHGLNFTVES